MAEDSLEIRVLGPLDVRRGARPVAPAGVRRRTLLALLSFSVSLRFFNEGEIFWSAPLAYPPLAYLLGRCLWIARRDRPPRASAPVWPVWLLAAACVLLSLFASIAIVQNRNRNREFMPYVAGTLLAIRRVGGFKGLVRGLDALME